ncbi:hypothetical protein [Marininema halotolerans]|uniref:hypothetical protein n=1 Tax=Marininema halotolerans TaxID=1155944 RepID=UPI000B8622E1|nr:hypothetical protein [Marininema halotolerans]
MTSRKYRVDYPWMFHNGEQMPREVRLIIESTLPHYSLYATSKKTFLDLKEEIAPYTVEDGMRLKHWHAINVIRSGGEAVHPFIAKMAAPPLLDKK